jgi:hypothetical protein
VTHPLFEVALLAIIPKKDLAFNGNGTGGRAEFYFFLILLFFGDLEELVF